MAMYSRELFATNESRYFEALKNNPSHFIHKCDQKVLNWLSEIKKKKISFLVTGSHIDFASLTAEHAMGSDWQNYFDIIICFAKKPGFFTMDRNFLQLDGIKETDLISSDNMKTDEVYTQGNFKELKIFFAKLTNKKDPQILYMGDNLIQDIFTPNKHVNIDTIAIVEEIMAEGVNPNPDYEILCSNKWGSYFHSNGEDTLWERIIRKHAKICVPSVDELAQNPLDYKYNLDYKYYPFDPFDPITK
jgi:HAD superfamily 5'-nucleotidase-like hydrolase